MSLQNDHRPTSLDEIFGNDETVESLQRILHRKNKKIPHSFLFHGPFGCGKTTFAKVICNELSVEQKDIKFLNMSNYTGIDHIRDLLSKIRYKPLESEYRVYIMDEVHRITSNSMDCLLNDLEKPPSHVIFILCTTEPEKLLKTIRSRCHQFAVKQLNKKVMVELLSSIAKKEKKKLSDKILNEIALQTEGTPRDALVLLDKIIDIKEEKKALKIIEEHVPFEDTEAFELVKKFVSGKLTWKEAAKIIKSLDNNVDYEKLRHGMMAYAEAVLLNSGNVKCFALLDVLQEKTFMYTKRKGLTWVFYYLLNEV